MTQKIQNNHPILPKSLSIKHLFNHYFLLHDFFQRLTKSKAPNSAFFDLQIDIQTGMKNAVSTGAKTSQFSVFGAMTIYFLKGNSIRLRFLYGFLFMYWFNHIVLMGSYMGVLFRMPSVYKKCSLYYLNHPSQQNYLLTLDELMDTSHQYEETQPLLNNIFGLQNQQRSFVSNQFYVKNKEKYIPKQILQHDHMNQLKLKYLDCFLSRYIYYSFARWFDRVKDFLSFQTIQ